MKRQKLLTQLMVFLLVLTSIPTKVTAYADTPGGAEESAEEETKYVYIIGEGREEEETSNDNDAEPEDFSESEEDFGEPEEKK